jgi:prepilin-type processing-associated H-X9-DG protein
MLIVGVLAMILVASAKRHQDKARSAACSVNLRTIVAGTLSWATDRNGMLWSREEIGYSRYRQADDTLGLPKMLEEYVPVRAWACPGMPKEMRKFRNGYTWSVASQFDTTPVPAVSSAMKTLLYFDAYSFSLPSLIDRPELSTGTWPTALPSKFQVKWHHGYTSANWAFLDGHIITGPTASQ